MYKAKHSAAQLQVQQRAALITGLAATVLTAGVLSAAAPAQATFTSHPGQWVATSAGHQKGMISLEQPDAITTGSTAILHGKAGSNAQPVKDATIYVDQKVNDDWTFAGDTQTNGKGEFALPVKPTTSVSFRVTAAAAQGKKGNSRGASAEVQLQVNAVPQPPKDPEPKPAENPPAPASTPAPAPAPAPAAAPDPAPAPAPAPPAPDRGQQAVDAAASHAGAPYVFGAAGPDAFDCSGLVMVVYQQFGISLPHLADDQANYGTPVSADEARPGDLVFFGDGYYHHVGIYAGNGEMWDAPNEQEVVQKEPVWDESHVFRRVL